MRIPRDSRALVLVVALAGATALGGCSGFKFAAPPAPQIGEPLDAERQRQADRKADQLGEKPRPVDYSRN